LTEVIKAEDSRSPEKAALILKRGGIIIYPTETLYGIGAVASQKEDVERVFEIKGRPLGKPIPVLGRDKRMLQGLVEFNESASLLAEKCWPGPLTLVLTEKGSLPELITACTGKAAVRVSANHFVARLFNFLDEPLTSTSANLSGSDNLLQPDDILKTFDGKVELIIDSGNIPPSKGSTVVDATTVPPVILRQGDLDSDQIKEFLNAGS
jgi:L-threonylcarbamoyladenylate synthase